MAFNMHAKMRNNNVVVVVLVVVRYYNWFLSLSPAYTWSHKKRIDNEFACDHHFFGGQFVCKKLRVSKRERRVKIIKSVIMQRSAC